MEQLYDDFKQRRQSKSQVSYNRINTSWNQTCDLKCR